MIAYEFGLQFGLGLITAYYVYQFLIAGLAWIIKKIIDKIERK